jgi:hypothetical protein
MPACNFNSTQTSHPALTPSPPRRFYVWHPVDTHRPLILIPEAQFAVLLHQISASFKHLFLNAKEARYRDIGLVIEAFPSHPDLRPRFLGTSRSREQYENMVQNTPLASFRPIAEPDNSKPADPRDKKAFRQMIEDAVELNKARSKAVKTRREEERRVKLQNIGKQLKRAQRYLGLRYKREKGKTFSHPERLWGNSRCFEISFIGSHR